MSALFLSAVDVDATILQFTSEELVTLMANVFFKLSYTVRETSSFAQTDMSLPHRTVISTPSHHVLFMPSRLAPFGTAVKVVSAPGASASQEARALGLPATSLLMDENTGQVKAIVNAGKLTALRNAAGMRLSGSLLSFRLIASHARAPINVVAIGSGAQIAAHISLFLSHYPSIDQCTIFNRSVNSRLTNLLEQLRGRLASRNVRFFGHALPTSDSEEDTEERRLLRRSLQDAQIVITATSSTKPLFPSSYITAGTHICLIGSYTPQMHEIDTDLVKRAGTVVVDSTEGCKREAGELIAAGLLDSHSVEMGELIASASNTSWEGNQALIETVRNSGDVTIFKSVGVGAQDVAIASLVVDKAMALGVGTLLTL
ncbi:NAD(P)-binding protein [Cristinia sonorae]|uniref:NAD(P)-binding protein n=1 Tax=Cristinia sonorae TaxID=1940300 RepID=A0A8K0XTG6_9AGAR|nr:NAD(P)-binding protein [Cristinia sonorae]